MDDSMTLAEITTVQWWVIFLGLAEMGLLLIAILWALLQSSKMPAPSLLVMSISLITILIMVVYVITRQNEVLTLAGVPVGALVTAATGVFQGDFTATQKVVTAVSERLEEATAAQQAEPTQVVIVEDPAVGGREVDTTGRFEK